MFKSTLNLIPCGVLLIDIQSKKITFANKEMQELLDIKDGADLYTNLKVCVSRFFYHSKKQKENDSQGQSLSSGTQSSQRSSS